MKLEGLHGEIYIYDEIYRYDENYHIYSYLCPNPIYGEIYRYEEEFQLYMCLNTTQKKVNTFKICQV